MAAVEPRRSSGYSKPPWIFKGSALYQLHLVKAETAKAFIPKDFKLVEAFGYTLGGFFLASYDDSPAGVFDELVVIAGIVWNPPTSCAWAARVLVNSDEACDHGRKYVGLPSQVARFSKGITAVPKSAGGGRSNGFLNMVGLGGTFSPQENFMNIKVAEINGPATSDICNIKLPLDVLEPNLGHWKGPAIKMSLPSFSGNTEFNPNLLKYSCNIHCRVRPVPPAIVSRPPHELQDDDDDGSWRNGNPSRHDLSIRSVMLSKPILALQFKCLNMSVEAPVVISPSKSLKLH